MSRTRAITTWDPEDAVFWRVVAACVGPVTAGPLLERGVTATWP